MSKDELRRLSVSLATFISDSEKESTSTRSSDRLTCRAGIPASDVTFRGETAHFPPASIATHQVKKLNLESATLPPKEKQTVALRRLEGTTTNKPICKGALQLNLNKYLPLQSSRGF